MRQIIIFNNKNWELPEPWSPPGPANDEIWYTSEDGNIVTPAQASSLPTIVSNTYIGGKGIIKFATDVTSIGNSAFDNRTKMTSVEIPDSVTSIGNSAFWAIHITSFTITINVATINAEAFKYCSRLADIYYTGTIAQYNAITKGNNWHQGVPATVVHCTDGDTPI